MITDSSFSKLSKELQYIINSYTYVVVSENPSHGEILTCYA